MQPSIRPLSAHLAAPTKLARMGASIFPSVSYSYCPILIEHVPPQVNAHNRNGDCFTASRARMASNPETPSRWSAKTAPCMRAVDSKGLIIWKAIIGSRADGNQSTWSIQVLTSGPCTASSVIAACRGITSQDSIVSPHVDLVHDELHRQLLFHVI